MFEQVLFSALQEDLSSALSSPEQLELLLLVMRRFSSTLSPSHLDKLLGTTSIINTHTLSWYTCTHTLLATPSWTSDWGLPPSPTHTVLLSCNSVCVCVCRLVEVVKSAVCSMKKESVLPAVASDLLHVSLREGSFTFFWDKVVIEGLMSEPTGPSQ